MSAPFPFESIFRDETVRLREFPVATNRVFFAHAGVTALPRRVADAVIRHTEQSCTDHQEFGDVLDRIQSARRSCAALIGADDDEIALLGPTSLGLSLFARGLKWEAGDEILCYADDYPANVYPWLDLRRKGVIVRFLEPERPGEITAELVAAAMGEHTRLVALASCHFLTGARLDVDAIGRVIHERGALFSLDAIQTLGAFPTRVEHVDFLSADSHKWLLGPLTAGIVYVGKAHFEKLHPVLLGAWNVDSPNFIAQDEIRLPDTARRYEPGVLNAPGIFGMQAAIDMLLDIGIDRVAARILETKSRLVAGLETLGCDIHGPKSGPAASGITTFRHPHTATADIFKSLEAAKVAASHRHDRAGREYIRLSPHFYNTEAETDTVLEAIGRALSAG